jgi:ABC-type microcin C transport system permease subunit YejB
MAVFAVKMQSVADGFTVHNVYSFQPRFLSFKTRQKTLFFGLYVYTLINYIYQLYADQHYMLIQPDRFASAFDATNMHVQYISFEFGEDLVKKCIRKINCASSALANCTVGIK